MANRSETISFTVGPNTRAPDDAGVAALDDALAKVGRGAELLHLFDPRRINAFSSGGPPVWSTAYVPIEGHHYFVTYGFSDRIDPARAGCGFELAIRVPEPQAGVWPAMLLRSLARYMLTTRRELKVGDFIPFFEPITRMPFAPAEKEAQPDTALDAVIVVADPLLPRVQTPRGEIEIRRVMGIDARERELMEPWSVKGLTTTISARAPGLVTDVSRRSFADDEAFVAAMTAGSEAEGSQFAFVAVPRVMWTEEDGGYTVKFPGGADAMRIHRMIQARLPHGRTLLVHDTDPEQRRAIAFVPGEESTFTEDGDVLVVTVPEESPLLTMFAQELDDDFVLKLG